MREFERIVDGHSSTFERIPTGTTLPRGKPPYETSTFGSRSQHFA
jgi:hypothetical protein